MATKVMVSLPGEADYAVRIGAGVLDALGRNLRSIERFTNARDTLVITDSNVGPLYLARTRTALAAEGFQVRDITVPAGETTKSIDVAAEIWSAMAQLSLGRDCFVVALGGGVVGDLAGFVASTYMRGVPVVQVPTTLLSMVDSSVGGKTAVNLPEGKNLVGTFFQPSFVCADTATLATLPQREWLCGCGEIAKSAVIDSDDFFFWLLDHAHELAERDPETTEEAIARCVIFKADVVARDKTETAGVRECLNYGHTLGHAIEACAGFGTFSHGACVAEGMRFAARLAVELAERNASARAGASSSATASYATNAIAPGCDGARPDAIAEFAAAQADLLDALGLSPLAFDAAPDELLSAMKHDKKARNGGLRFVIVDDIAAWRIETLADDLVLSALELTR